MNVRKKILIFAGILTVFAAVLTVVNIGCSRNIGQAARKYAAWSEVDNTLSQNIMQNLYLCNSLCAEFELRQDRKSYDSLLAQLDNVIAGAEKAKLGLYENERDSAGVNRVETVAIDAERIVEGYFSCLEKYRRVEQDSNLLLDQCYNYIKEVNSGNNYGVDPTITECVLKMKLALDAMFDNYSSESEARLRSVLAESMKEADIWQERIREHIKLNQVANEVKSFIGRTATAVNEISVIAAELKKKSNGLTEITGLISQETGNIRKTILAPEKAAVQRSMESSVRTAQSICWAAAALIAVLIAGMTVMLLKSLTAPLRFFERTLAGIVQDKNTETVIPPEYLADRHEIGVIARAVQNVQNDYRAMARLISICGRQLMYNNELLVSSNLLSNAEKCEKIICEFSARDQKRRQGVEEINSELGNLTQALQKDSKISARRRVDNISSLLNDLKAAEQVIHHAGRNGMEMKYQRPAPFPRPRPLEKPRLNSKMLAGK